MDGNKMLEPARIIPETVIATRFTTLVMLDIEAVEFGLAIASTCIQECRLTGQDALRRPFVSGPRIVGRLYCLSCICALLGLTYRVRTSMLVQRLHVQSDERFVYYIQSVSIKAYIVEIGTDRRCIEMGVGGGM